MIRAKASSLISTGILASFALFAASSSVYAGPIGYLQIDGQIDVQATDSAKSIRISENNYTVFSGDRLATRKGSAVLMLDQGGAIGLTPASEAAISMGDDPNDLVITLSEGTMLFSVPPRAGNVRVNLGDFVLSSQSSDPRAMQVSSDAYGLAGMVQRLESGHIHVAVNEGALAVTSGRGSVYQISAGDQIGLLAGSEFAVQRSADGVESVVRIEAPGRVNANTEFSVRLDGAIGNGESFITIAPSGSDPAEFERVMSTAKGNTLEFTAPEDEGDYEIRYVSGATGEVSSFVYLQVVGTPAAVVPAVAPAVASGLGASSGVIGAIGAGTAALGGAALVIGDDEDDLGPNSVSP